MPDATATAVARALTAAILAGALITFAPGWQAARLRGRVHGYEVFAQ